MFFSETQNPSFWPARRSHGTDGVLLLFLATRASPRIMQTEPRLMYNAGRSAPAAMSMNSTASKKNIPPDFRNFSTQVFFELVRSVMNAPPQCGSFFLFHHKQNETSTTDPQAPFKHARGKTRQHWSAAGAWLVDHGVCSPRAFHVDIGFNLCIALFHILSSSSGSTSGTFAIASSNFSLLARFARSSK